MSKRPWERFKQACIEEKVAYVSGSVLLWAEISSESCTKLVFIENGGYTLTNGSLTIKKYVKEILNEHFGPFVVILGE